MERIDRMLADPSFQEAFWAIEKYEETRVFCKHGLAHCFDVARIAYIISLEAYIDIPKDMIYAAALIHDIGRSEEYRNGKPHDIAGQEIGRHLLEASGFLPDEIEEICLAIKEHRGDQTVRGSQLAALLYRADKQSRPCFLCTAASECYWAEEKKNKVMHI